jgi:phosphoglycolate phosphatase
MAKAKLIIFDFDGTLADTMEAIVRAYNGMAPELGTKPITAENREMLRASKPQAVFRELGISLLRLPGMLARGRRLLAQEADKLETFDGMKELLAGLQRDGYRLGILTTNSEENVRAFLKRNEMEAFEFVHSEANAFGKAPALRNVLKQAGIAPRDAVYVGDEVRDIEAASAAGMPAIGVAWGFNSRPILESSGASAIADVPSAFRNALARVESR